MNFKLFDTEIFSGNDALLFLSQQVQLHFSSSQKIILVDSNTKVQCLPVLLNACTELSDAFVIEIPNGEENKNIKTTGIIWSRLNDLHTEKSSVIINLGGGVVTDMGAFAASTFKRGINFIHIPTTLLSMCDAAIGGKTGIDFDGIKNAIGTFAQPHSIFVYPEFLKTLDERQLKSGYAEIVKHALVFDSDLFKILNQNPFEKNITTEVIEKSMLIKCKIVEEDFEEKNLRKLLNFGHTAGHAIESYFLNSPRPLLHGESIAIGMAIETILSVQRDLLSKDETEIILQFLLKNFNLPKIETNIIDEVIDWMKHDKKNTNQLINFTLLDYIGNGCINNTCSINEVKTAFNGYNDYVAKQL